MSYQCCCLFVTLHIFHSKYPPTNLLELKAIVFEDFPPNGENEGNSRLEEEYYSLRMFLNREVYVTLGMMGNWDKECKMAANFRCILMRILFKIVTLRSKVSNFYIRYLSWYPIY